MSEDTTPAAPTTPANLTFAALKANYAKVVTTINTRQIQPPDARFMGSMGELDRLIRLGNGEITGSAQARMSAQIKFLDAYMTSQLGDIWLAFRSAAAAHIAGA
jgi:hypothetical protein